VRLAAALALRAPAAYVGAQTLAASRFGGGGGGANVSGGAAAGTAHVCAVEAGFAQAWCWGWRGSFGAGAGAGAALSPVALALPGALTFAAPRAVVASTFNATENSTTTVEAGVTTSVAPSAWISVAAGAGFTCAVFAVAPGSLTSTLVDPASTTTPGGGPGGRRALGQPGAPGAPGARSLQGNASLPAPTLPNAACFGERWPGSGAGAGAAALVSPTVAWASLSAGAGHACGVTAAGAALCFGSGANGRLGNNATADVAVWAGAAPAAVLVPPAAGGSARVVQAACGDSFSCVLRADGRVFCFGSNAGGRLGAGLADDGDYATPQPLAFSFSSSFSATFASIAVGATHACALDFYARLYCWGWSGNAQSSSGGALSYPAAARAAVWVMPALWDAYGGPVVVGGRMALNANVAYSGPVSAGGTHSCVVTGAVGGVANSAGQLHCWGGGARGQLGETAASTGLGAGALLPIAAPRAPGLAPTGAGGSDLVFGAALAAGGASTCALRRADGAAVCFGDRASGALGDGLAAPPQLTAGAGSGAWAAVSLASGGGGGCAIAAGDGALLCWGAFLAPAAAAAPLPAAVPSLPFAGNWTAVAAGAGFACALHASGAAYCFGAASAAGQLGGAPAAGGGALQPVQLATAAFGAQWRALAAGRAHACGIALQGSRLHCWGDASDLRLGVAAGGAGAPAFAAAPTDVGVAADAVACGAAHSCWLAPGGGAVTCAGSNARGQLTQAPAAASGWVAVASAAAALPAGDAWASLAAGDAHTCALSRGGALACFGDGAEGQLGAGWTLPAGALSAGAAAVAVPRGAGPGAYFSAVAAGAAHTCALVAQPTLSASPSPSPSATPSGTRSPSATFVAASASATRSLTSTATLTASASGAQRVAPGASSSRTPSPSATPSGSPRPSPPPTPYFAAALDFAPALTAAAAAAPAVRAAIAAAAAAAVGLPAGNVSVVSVADGATGAVVWQAAGAARRLAGRRGLQAGAARVAILALTGPPNSGGPGAPAGAASSAALAALLAAQSAAPATWALVAAAAGLPAGAVTAAVPAGSVAVEPSFLPFVAPTPSATPTATPTLTPVVTGLAAVDTQRAPAGQLSGFTIAGFVAAGVGGACLLAGVLLCVRLGLARCCCPDKGAGRPHDVGADAAREHAGGAGPLRIGVRRAKDRRSDGLALRQAATDNTDKVDAAEFGEGAVVVANPEALA